MSMGLLVPLAAGFSVITVATARAQTPIHVLDDSEALGGSLFGWDVDTAGDVNGDGVLDVRRASSATT